VKEKQRLTGALTSRGLMNISMTSRRRKKGAPSPPSPQMDSRIALRSAIAYLRDEATRLGLDRVSDALEQALKAVDEHP
jgi:hypothetical protein